MGTAIISLLLLALVSGVIASIIKDKRKGRHPSCGGHCGSCGHVCSAYQKTMAILENQGIQKQSRE